VRRGRRVALVGVAAAADGLAPFQLPEQPLAVDIVAKYFRGFGDPTRLRILEALTDGERSVGELVELIDAPQPKVSAHLACLRWCGFVETRRDFRTVYYRIADKRVLKMLELAHALLADNAEHVAACRQIDGGPC
jgi:ArsR family transcriptional regulator, cadmium/lead-responsive transcriptional repressor